MTEINNIEELEHMLPFYANGTLQERDRLAVDAALDQSQHLQAVLREHLILMSEVKGGGEMLTRASRPIDEQLEIVLARIDALEPTLSAPIPSAKVAASGHNLKSLLSFLSPSAWHPAVSLALMVALVAQGAILLAVASDSQSKANQVAALEKRVGDLEFQLASGPDDGTSQSGIVVQVRPTAKWQEIETLLRAQRLTIQEGPNDNTLLLGSSATGQALDTLIERLRASPVILAADKAA